MQSIQQIQAALEATGYPTFFGKWHPPDDVATELPPEYAVFDVRAYETDFQDDAATALRRDAYIVLYAKDLPPDAIGKVRAAMRGIGYNLTEERTNVEFDARTHTVHWTWTRREPI